MSVGHVGTGNVLQGDAVPEFTTKFVLDLGIQLSSSLRSKVCTDCVIIWFEVQKHGLSSHCGPVWTDSPPGMPSSKLYWNVNCASNSLNWSLLHKDLALCLLSQMYKCAIYTAKAMLHTGFSFTCPVVAVYMSWVARGTDCSIVLHVRARLAHYHVHCFYSPPTFLSSWFWGLVSQR
jgi:hypothetical protein